MDNEGIIILGMHRSGTSVTTGLLRAAGVFIGRDEKLLASASDNPRGFNELEKVTRLNDWILKMMGTTWYKPMPDNWLTEYAFSSVISQYKIQLGLILRNTFKDAPLWAVKDPRMCRLLPVINEVLIELGCKINYIIVDREPEEIVASLDKRNGLTREQTIQLIKEHWGPLYKYTDGKDRIVISFKDVLHNTRETLEFIQDGIREPLDLNNIDGIVDLDMVHHGK